MKIICGYKHTHAHQDVHTLTHTVRHHIYDSRTTVPRGYWTFSSVINVSVLIDDLYCNYLLKSRNRIIRKGLEGRKVLIQWEFCGGNQSAEGDKVHGSPQNSVSANGEEGRDLQEESMIRANGILMM